MKLKKRQLNAIKTNIILKKNRIPKILQPIETDKNKI